MLDKKVAELINTQVNKEFYSAYLYLDFANYYKDAELNGFCNWYQVQAQEERDHAMLFIQYLQNNGEKITLEAIAKPDRVFEDFRGPLAAGLEHENYVTGLIQPLFRILLSLAFTMAAPGSQTRGFFNFLKGISAFFNGLFDIVLCHLKAGTYVFILPHYSTREGAV